MPRHSICMVAVLRVLLDARAADLEDLAGIVDHRRMSYSADE